MRTKRLLAILSSVCMLAGMLSGISVSAAETLQAQIDAAADGTTLTLDADYTEAVTVAADKTLTIDLNGHTLTGVGNRALVNMGTLTLTDSGENGKIQLFGTVDLYAVENLGTLTVHGGTITAVTSGDALAQGINNMGTLTIDGGSVSATTTGNKWAIALVNGGVVEKVNADLYGEINNTATADVNTLAISNETGALIKEIAGGNLIGRLNNNGIAYGIRNRGTIEKISGGNVYAVTTGVKWAYALHNEASGMIGTISGGSFIGEIDRESNGNNALGMRNDGTVDAITGGLFRGDILNANSTGYGLRNDAGAIKSISGGMYRGNLRANAVIKQGGTLTYADGFNLFSDKDNVGYRYVAEKNSKYTEILDEYEKHVATYLYDANGAPLRTLGSPKASYEVYLDGTPTVQQPEQFATDQNTTLIEHTTDKPVYYFLGSSVTIGAANNGVSFADYIAEETDWICHKRAFSGTTLVNSGVKSYVQRLRNDIPQSGRITHLIVQLSTNDASQNKPLGSLSDSFELSDFKQTTVYGAMEYIVCYAKTVLGCEVSFYTNPKYSNSAYTRMLTALDAIAEKWDLQTLDFYHYKNMNPFSDATLRSYMADDIHPNAAGYHWMAGEFVTFLNSYEPLPIDVYKILLDQTALTLAVGQQATLAASVLPTNVVDQAVGFSSSDPEIVTVDASGNLTAVSAGEATVTAKAANGKTASCKVKVEIYPTAMQINLRPMSVGESLRPTVTFTPSNTTATALTWSSSNPAVASVDPSTGAVTANLPGKTTVTATAVNGITASYALTVSERVVKVSAVKISGKTSLTIGGKTTLTAIVSPQQATNTAVTWNSANPKIATVNAYGKVTAKKAGKVTVTATAKDGSGAKARITITVKPKAVKGLKVTAKRGKVTVSYKKSVKGAQYILRIQNAKGKKVLSKTVKTLKWVARSKKLKTGKYTVTVICKANGIQSATAKKGFRIK